MSRDTLCVMTGPRTTGKASTKRRDDELKSVASFMAERCEEDVSEFSPFRDLFAAYQQFRADSIRRTREDVEISATRRPGWASLSPGEQVAIRAEIREAFGPYPVDMGSGMFSVALIRLGYDPHRRRRVPGHSQPINVVSGIRLIEPRPAPIPTDHL